MAHALAVGDNGTIVENTFGLSSFPTFTPDLRTMAIWLVQCGITTVVRAAEAPLAASSMRSSSTRFS